MARNDGVDRVSVRNVNLTRTKVVNAQRHNEREKIAYTNPDIVSERMEMNVHYKAPTGSYTEMFDQMEKEGVISTRGLKQDACHFGELIFDVNSAYFYNHGGYEFAKQFYEDTYKAAIQIVGSENYILSAVMHADERNSAMSEAIGEDVYHYHLHVVYIPVVEKQILRSKRCKDKELIGMVKETIMQVSSSKKWISKPAVDEQGNPVLQKNGKPVLRKSYSILQDDFFEAMCDAGYTDVERGERSSSEEHLTVTQFKVEKEKARLQELEKQTQKREQLLEKIDQKTKVKKETAITFDEIDRMGKNTIFGKVELTKAECEKLKNLAKKGAIADAKISDLREKLRSTERDMDIWRHRYDDLNVRTRDYQAAMQLAPNQVREAVERVLSNTGRAMNRSTRSKQREEMLA